MAAEPRDRLNRTVDHAAIYARRKSSGFLLDTLTPINPSASRHGLIGVRGIFSVGGGIGRANLGSARGNVGRGQSFRRSTLAIDRENTPLMSGGRHGRGRGTNSVLPAWYRRTPLRDVTTVVRAIERWRARLSEVENNHGQETEIPQLQDQGLPNFATPLPGALLEYENSTMGFTPNPTNRARAKAFQLSIGKIPRILHNVVTQQTAAGGGESEFLTPQKKLLNSIDTVEKEVLEELRKLERTPVTKRAIRENKVRTLMQMR